MRAALALGVIVALNALISADADLPVAAACGVEQESALGTPCVSTKNGFTICEQAVPGSDAEVEITLLRDSHEVQRWKAEVFPAVGALVASTTGWQSRTGRCARHTDRI